MLKLFVIVKTSNGIYDYTHYLYVGDDECMTWSIAVYFDMSWLIDNYNSIFKP